MSFNPFKLNRISLLKQSGFNILLKKVLVPKKKLDIYKNLLINNKNIEKKFNFHFIPIQIINENEKIKGNHSKTNPLSEKNKIIKRHNILQKIDFNTNSLKNNPNLNNQNLEMNSNNNNKLNIYNNNTSNFSNKINENPLNLPLLTNSNKSINKSSKRINNINFSKSNNSPSYNDFLQYHLSSPSVKLFNDANNIFTNEKIKNTSIENLEQLSSIYTDKGMQTNNDNIPNKEYNEKNKYHINSNLKDKKSKYKEDSDESSSNDFEDIKEIENIISKSNRDMNNKRSNYNYYKFTYENSDKKKVINTINKLKNNCNNENIKEFPFLKNISSLKDDYLYGKNEKSFKQSKTSRDIYFKNENSLNNEYNDKYNNLKCFNKNISLYNSNEENRIFNYKKKLIQKKNLYYSLDKNIIKKIS